MNGYKVLTQDNVPPIQGGKPLFPLNATYPIVLPKVDLDISEEDCASGWNFCADTKTTLSVTKITGKFGLNNRIYKVTGSSDSIIRKNKIRCSQLTINSLVTDFEEFKLVEEPSNKQKELFEWFNLTRKPINNLIIKTCLLKTLKIKDMSDWSVVIHNNYNNYNYNYYNNYNNYYNNYNNYNSCNYYYYWISESLLELNPNFRKSMILAYIYGMQQIRFESDKKILHAYTML